MRGLVGWGVCQFFRIEVENWSRTGLTRAVILDIRSPSDFSSGSMSDTR